MREQLHRRLPQTLVEEILAAFRPPALSKVQACELLGRKRIRLYALARRYLRFPRRGHRAAHHRCSPVRYSVWLGQR